MRVGVRVVAAMVMVAALVAVVPPQRPVAAQTVAFTAGELLGKPTDTSITVNIVPSQTISWRVQYGTSPGNYTDTTSSSNASAGNGSEITIGGLAPDTRYHYRVQYSSGGGAWQNRPAGMFHTQRGSGSPFTFVIQSDAHIVEGPANNFTFYENAIDNMVDDEPDFLLDLGDMFAISGSAAATRSDHLVQRGYLEPLTRNAATFLAVGNHENEEGWWRVSGDNQPIISTNARKEFWANPVPNGFYTGDTTDHSGLGVSGDGLREAYYRWEWGDALFVVLDPFWNTTSRPHSLDAGLDPVQTPVSDNRWDWTLGETQFDWLRSTLASSTKPYKFVFIHQLVGGTSTYGRGGGQAVDAGFEWGANDSTFATNRSGWDTDSRNAGSIHSILDDNGVDAVFHGHDHCYATEVRDGIVYQEVPMPSSLAVNNGFCSNYDIGTPEANPGHVRVDVTSGGFAAVRYVRSNTNQTQGWYGLSPGNGPFTAIAPIVDAGPDQMVDDLDDNGSELVNLDGSDTEDLNGTITDYSWIRNGQEIATGATPTVSLGVGTHVITLEATDNGNNTRSDTVTVTVREPADADAGPDQTVIDGNDNGIQSVDLDGTGSSSPNGAIVSYIWTDSGGQVATGPSPTVNLPLGTHEITLTVTDVVGLSGTDTVIVKVTPPPVMPATDRYIVAQARYGNDVSLGGFGNGTVTVDFSAPGGGPVCPDFVTTNGGGNPGCDLQQGWRADATGSAGIAEVTIRDLAIVDLVAGADLVTIVVKDPDQDLTFGCGGNVAIAYGADVDDGAAATRMVSGPGRTSVDFSAPGPCPGGFDNTTVDVKAGGDVYLTAWENDGDRTLETRSLAAPFTCSADPTPFTDVAHTSFAYADIACIHDLELTTGTSPTTYGPAEFVTREQMAAFLARLARMFGVTAPGGHPFTDVSPTSFAYGDIALIYNLGVTTGTGDGTTYSPKDLVTREQMAAFLARLYSVVFGTPFSPVLALVHPTPFTDVAISSFAHDDIGRIFGLELTTGTSPTTYGPGDYVTREQMAAFLARLIRILHFV